MTFFSFLLTKMVSGLKELWPGSLHHGQSTKEARVMAGPQYIQSKNVRIFLGAAKRKIAARMGYLAYAAAERSRL